MFKLGSKRGRGINLGNVYTQEMVEEIQLVSPRLMATTKPDNEVVDDVLMQFTGKMMMTTRAAALWRNRHCS